MSKFKVGDRVNYEGDNNDQGVVIRIEPECFYNYIVNWENDGEEPMEEEDLELVEPARKSKSKKELLSLNK